MAAHPAEECAPMVFTGRFGSGDCVRGCQEFLGPE